MPSKNIAGKGSRFNRAVEIFKDHGGALRTAKALRAGIHPETLYALRDSGIIERISRGLYRLADSQPMGNPDLVTVAARVSAGCSEKVADMDRNGWPRSIGTGGRNRPE